MFIAIIGTRFAGKSSVQDYLIHSKGFTPVRFGDLPGEVSESIIAGDNTSDFFDDAGSDASQNSNGNLDGDISPILEDFPTPDRVESRSSFLYLTPSAPSSRRNIKPPRSPPRESLYFSSSSELLDYATLNWTSNFVTVDLDAEHTVEKFVKRPWFMLIRVDAPLLDRYRRANHSSAAASSLEDFICEHDALLYGSESSKTQTPRYRTQKSNTDWSNLHSLSKFVTLDITLASLASMRSNCMKRRVGAILVRNNRILATGYNGTPRGLKNCNEGGCAQCNKAESLAEACLCLHAEENALLEAGRDRIGDGAVLYCNTCPCLTCTIKIVQTGVKDVVYNLSYKVDDASAKIFEEAGVRLRRHAPK
ncbi:hypothetical protein EW146_g6744 [Bondarzewia mesenterica]|uniref:Deoxycytidylate deaminase n=1 Tax=Bondarzewia mesenterica TaxID=1095465 RepID=A0A4S4LMM6_9AGAM|nr:hypothetical protein EW146_g6744 [Bondarzewia mesenterica]